MSDLLIGIGFLLAIFGPLLLVPVTWLLYRLAVRPLVQRLAPPTFSTSQAPTSNVRWLAWFVSAAIVAVVIVASYLPGRWEFDRMCSQHAVPSVSDQVEARGFFRTRLFPYEAAQYLRDGSFEFVEAPHPYQQGEHVRYSRSDAGKIDEQPIPTISAAYGVRKTFSELSGSLTMTEKVIYEIATERELARAASINYHGGPLSILLGTSGMTSCPDILSEEGSRHFGTFYELESIVLQDQPLP